MLCAQWPSQVDKIESTEASNEKNGSGVRFSVDWGDFLESILNFIYSLWVLLTA